MINSNTKNNVRLSVSMPWYVREQLLVHAKQGQVSDFVASAVSEKISRNLVAKQSDPWKAFLGARRLITKTNKISVRAAINKGRM